MHLVDERLRPRISEYDQAKTLAVSIIREFGPRSKWDLHRGLIDFGVRAGDALQVVRSLIDDGELLEGRGRTIHLPPKAGVIAWFCALLDRLFGTGG